MFFFFTFYSAMIYMIVPDSTIVIGHRTRTSRIIGLLPAGRIQDIRYRIPAPDFRHCSSFLQQVFTMEVEVK